MDMVLNTMSSLELGQKIPTFFYLNHQPFIWLRTAAELAREVNSVRGTLLKRVLVRNLVKHNTNPFYTRSFHIC